MSLLAWSEARTAVPRRDEVFRILDAAVATASAAKVLVCAPAGAGKTTLLEAWIASHAGSDPAPNAAWLTLDPADNDAAQLQRRVRDALVSIELQDGTGVLVLDDTHTVTDTGALAHLTAFVESVPARITVVVSARRAPDLPWPKYASDGSLTFLGCEELALERDSIASIFAAHHGPLSEDELETVLELTAGWAGAVRSAALLVGSGGDVRGDITALLGRPQQVSGYVVGEMLAQLPADLVRFVLSTSVVERFTGALLEDLVGGNADLRLYECERSGIPVRREVVDGELTYSWHPLVRTHMRAVLRESDPEHYAALNVAAARSLAEAGHTLTAFTQLAAVSDEHIIEDFVQRYGPAAVFAGLGETVLEAIGARNGRLSCVQLLRALVALEANDPNAARAHLRKAASSPAGRVLSPAAGCFAAALRVEADLIGGAPISEETIEAVENHRGTKSIDLDCYILVQCAAAHMLSGRFARSERVLKDALALADLGGHPRLVLRCLARLAILAAMRGELVTMSSRAEHAVDYAAEHDLAERIDAAQCAAIACMCTYHRGEILAEDSPLHGALANTAVRVRPDGTTEPVIGNHSQVAFSIVRARCLPETTDEDVDAVGRAMLAVMMRGPHKGSTSNYVVTSVAVLLESGRSALAEDIVRGASEIFGSSPDVQVARALLALDVGATAIAERILRSVLESGPPQSRILAVQTWVLLAVAEARSRRQTDAVSSIRRALKLAEEHVILRPFMNFAGDVAELLTAIRPGQGVSQQFLDAVRSKLLVVSAGRNPGLTPTEKQVLAQLQTRRMLKEIAKEMHLSVNTVRTHARNLYRKLDVSSRDQAVEAAIRRGLL
ncbi:LuxR C-terminal-related transcriptional regulator [Rhodococcus sp. OK519]|uniref:helix-turn-helix transcriptional regulator n=1 Tax=Rhodococcus sp. OK519 TaxID=2135729 RepID=UPI0015E685CD